MTYEKEIEELRNSLKELQGKQIDEMKKIADVNRALRVQLDEAAAIVAKTSDERDALQGRLHEVEKNLATAMTKSSQFQRALELLTTSATDLVSNSTRDPQGCRDVAILTDIVPETSPRTKRKKRAETVPPNASMTSSNGGRLSGEKPPQPVMLPIPGGGLLGPRQATSPGRPDSWIAVDEDEDLSGSISMTKDKWVPDDSVQWCMAGCTTKFSLTVRKHHCRRCGRVFCDKCCAKSPMHDGRRICTLCLR